MPYGVVVAAETAPFNSKKKGGEKNMAGKPERGLYQRPGTANWYFCFQHNGRLFRGSTGTSNKSLAREIFTSKRAAVLRGEVGIVNNANVRFFDLCKRYAEAIQEKRTHRRDVQHIEVYKAFFGNRRLSDMQENDVLIQAYIRARLAGTIETDGKRWNPVRRTTVNRDLAILKHMFNLGREWKMCTMNPIKRGMIDRRADQAAMRTTYLEPDEVRAYLVACERQYYPVAAAAIFTGMRKSEILGLTWDRLDLINRVVHLDYTKGGKRREVKIPEILTDTLRKLESRRHGGFVFLNRDGQPYRDVRSAHNAALNRSGIRKAVVFHDLRHTFGTLLAKHCHDLNLVREALGHADITTTMRYAHVIPGVHREAIEGLASNLTAQKLAQLPVSRGWDRASQSVKEPLVIGISPT